MISKFPYDGVPTLMDQLNKYYHYQFIISILLTIYVVVKERGHENFGVDWHYITLPNILFGNNKKLFTQYILCSKIIL